MKDTQKIRTLEASIRIGKSGITDGVVKEIKKQIDKKGAVKIKLLRSFIAGKDKKKVAEEIAEKTKSKVVNMIGFVVVLRREP